MCTTSDLSKYLWFLGTYSVNFSKPPPTLNIRLSVFMSTFILTEPIKYNLSFMNKIGIVILNYFIKRKIVWSMRWSGLGTNSIGAIWNKWSHYASNSASDSPIRSASPNAQFSFFKETSFISFSSTSCFYIFFLIVLRELFNWIISFSASKANFFWYSSSIIWDSNCLSFFYFKISFSSITVYCFFVIILFLIYSSFFSIIIISDFCLVSDFFVCYFFNSSFNFIDSIYCFSEIINNLILSISSLSILSFSICSSCNFLD